MFQCARRAPIPPTRFKCEARPGCACVAVCGVKNAQSIARKNIREGQRRLRTGHSGNQGGCARQGCLRVTPLRNRGDAELGAVRGAGVWVLGSAFLFWHAPGESIAGATSRDVACRLPTLQEKKGSEIWVYLILHGDHRVL